MKNITIEEHSLKPGDYVKHVLSETEGIIVGGKRGDHIYVDDNNIKYSYIYLVKFVDGCDIEICREFELIKIEK
jgi:hypothetical protein